MEVPLLASNAHIDWWAGGAGAVVGAIIGSFIGSFVPLWSATYHRRQESLGEIAAMHVEFHLTLVALTDLIAPEEQRGRNLPPLYRLPTTICRQALPKLIGDNVLTRAEVAALVEYVNCVEEINRGLERAGEAHVAEQYVLMAMQDERSCEKARELLNQPLTTGSKPLFDVAKAALFRLEDELRASWWTRRISRMRRTPN